MFTHLRKIHTDFADSSDKSGSRKAPQLGPLQFHGNITPQTSAFFCLSIPSPSRPSLGHKMSSTPQP